MEECTPDFKFWKSVSDYHFKAMENVPRMRAHGEAHDWKGIARIGIGGVEVSGGVGMTADDLEFYLWLGKYEEALAKEPQHYTIAVHSWFLDELIQRYKKAANPPQVAETSSGIIENPGKSKVLEG